MKINALVLQYMELPLQAFDYFMLNYAFIKISKEN